MARDTTIQFAEFRLEPDNARLWHDTQLLKLKPKAFAVLHFLIKQAGQLVTKDEIWHAVWPDVTVGDGVLAASIRDIRKALGDNAKTPRFIETVHRRGYRFLMEVVSSQHSVASSREEENQKSKIKSQKSKIDDFSPAPPLVGRDTELSQLHQCLDKALNGERQIIFVTGEPGIGKSALVEVFLRSLESNIQRLEPEEESQNAKVKVQKSKVTDSRPLPPSPLFTQGQCIEQFGEGEAYLPLLTALGQLGRADFGPQLISVLKQHAPSWLVQLPAFVPTEEFPELRHRTTGTTRPRMLRELAEALEVLTVDQPLLLMLEDLHWSDPSTLEWLSLIAKRTSPARLMILGSYRPMEMLAPQHPLRAVLRELRLHQQCQEISLSLLTATEIATYLTQRIEVPSPFQEEEQSKSGTQLSFADLAQVLYQRTEGNPLFMVSLVNELATRGVFTGQQESGAWHEQVTVLTRDIPNNIRQFVTDQSDRLAPAEQRILEAASLAGMTFSTAAVAAALEKDILETEDGCARLAAQQRFLRPAGIIKWPDGTVAAGYGFLHALYQQLWNERVTASKLQQFHLRIGNRKEAAYGDRTGEIALELALHFEQGRDYHRAVQYLSHAGRNAIQRSAHHEAITLLSKGLAMLNEIPDSPERVQQELTLQISLGAPLMATRGFAAPEVRDTYTRALALCQQREDTPQVFPVRSGLWLFYMMRAELQTAREVGMQMLAQAERSQDTAMILQAHHTLWPTLCWLGELTLAREHLERGMVLYNLHQHHAHAFMYGGHDPGTCSLSFAARVLWALGYPDQALRRFQESLSLSDTVTHPFSLVNALFIAAPIHQFRQEIEALRQHAERQITVCQEQGFAQFLASGTILKGWALVEQGQEEEGLEQMRKAMDAYFATGAELWRPYFLTLLGETYGKVGRPEEGLGTINQALALIETTGERYYEAEIHRLKGELLLAQEVKNQKLENHSSQTLVLNAQMAVEAEACFHKAIDVARKQSAKSWELRATMSLVRLWQQQTLRHGAKSKEARVGNGEQELQTTQHESHNTLDEAHKLLSEIYNWFTEGFDTADLREAKALLEALGH